MIAAADFPNETTNEAVIGFVGSAFSQVKQSVYWTRLLSGVQEGLAAQNQRLVILNPPTQELLAQVNGILLCNNASNTQTCLAMMRNDMPCVSMLQPSKDHSVIEFDEYLGGQIGARHLLQLGHRRIMYLMEMHNSANPAGIEKRYLGFRNTLRSMNVPLDPEFLVDLKTITPTAGNSRRDYIEQSKKITRQWFSKNAGRGATAIFAQNDPAAMGAIEALEELGLRVPQDISVLGYDGAEIEEFQKVKLSTIELPLREMGRKAIEVLGRQIKARSNSRAYAVEELKLPVRLVEGATTSRLISL